jgi:hypothetical protein
MILCSIYYYGKASVFLLFTETLCSTARERVSVLKIRIPVLNDLYGVSSPDQLKIFMTKKINKYICVIDLLRVGFLKENFISVFLLYPRFL